MLFSNTKINLKLHLQQNKPRAVLLCGSNFDAIADSAKVVLAQYQQESAFGSNVIKISGSDLKNNSLFDIMHSKNLFHKYMVIYIQDLVPQNHEQIESVFENYQGNNLLLIRAAKLPKHNRLAQFFTNNNLLAVAHYPDNIMQTRDLIKHEIQSLKLNISPVQFRMLQQNLHGKSREFIRSYIRNLRAENAAQSKPLLNECSDMEFALHCLAGELKQMYQATQYRVAGSAIGMIRLLIYFLILVKDIHSEKHNTFYMNPVAQTIKPVVYTESKSYILDGLVQRWPMDKICSALNLLCETEKIILTSSGGVAFYQNTLLSICMQQLSLPLQDYGLE